MLAFARRVRVTVRYLPLLGSALAWVAVVRLGLTFSTYKALRERHLGGRVRPAGLHSPTAARVAWAVQRAARLVPRATCLTQALAAQIMLSRHNIVSVLHVGVRRDGAGTLLAHAWLVNDGVVLLGGTPETVSAFSELARYGPATT